MARYYDLMYPQNFYENTSKSIEKIFIKHSSINVKSILDVGCGTGSYTLIFARHYDLTGIDLSEEMLETANLKKKNNDSSAYFVHMDMRDIKLDKKYDVITLLYGGWGYLLKDSDVYEFLTSARKVLYNEGLLLFEFFHDPGMSKESRTQMGDHELKFWLMDGDNKLLIRHKLIKYDEKNKRLRYDYYFYEVDLNSKTIMKNPPEVHLTRSYTIPEMKNLLMKNGFTPLYFYNGEVGGDNLKEATVLDSRVFCVAKVSHI